MRSFYLEAQSVDGGTTQDIDLAHHAVAALRDELDLTPKPGLVDRNSHGAHRDMNHALMTASAVALTPGFAAMARAARVETDPARLRVELGSAGRDAEAAMMRVTAGVNTHRGAIWALGLIVAAAAATPCTRWNARLLLEWVARMASIDDPALAGVPSESNGARVMARYYVAGARGEAMAGFPQIVGAGLPTLVAARAGGAAEVDARLDALAAIIAVLDDTCVLHRAGAAGLAQVQSAAALVVEQGGAASVGGRAALARLDDLFLGLNASPGGAADLLAATLLIDRLETVAGERPLAQEADHADVIA